MIVRLTHNDVTSASMDGCSTSEAFVKQIEDDQEGAWTMNHCCAHCGNNSGAEAGFPTLDQF
jgi:hypothetical protein